MHSASCDDQVMTQKNLKYDAKYLGRKHASKWGQFASISEYPPLMIKMVEMMMDYFCGRVN